MTLDELREKKVAVLGLGVNHEHLVGYFRKHKIKFTVIKKWSSVSELDLSGYEIVFRTPSVPYLSKPIQDALSRGVEVYSQTKLFFDLCPAKIIGVTGTNGKGTTASLIYEILKRNNQTNQKSKIYLAGNIGKDPFEFLDELTPDDWVVLELSSFQLQDLHQSPHIAVVLKITPEHLDHHENFEEYVNAKLPIVKYQTKADLNVIDYDSEASRSFAGKSEAAGFWYSTEKPVEPGCFVADDKIVFASPLTVIMDVSEIGLIGRFNLENVAAAVAASFAAGVKDFSLMRQVIMGFKGLPHRLELVSEVRGTRFYNDSFSTTPETAAAAISAFDAPIVLIAGGSDKNADYTDLGRTIADRQVKALLAIGITGPKIAAAARAAGFAGKIYDTNLSDMQKIVAKANEVSSPGDVVLLSPASASFDMFENYKQRGELFKKYVNKLTNKSSEIRMKI